MNDRIFIDLDISRQDAIVLMLLLGQLSAGVPAGTVALA